jgi:hypothetical protein
MTGKCDGCERLVVAPPVSWLRWNLCPFCGSKMLWTSMVE